MAAPTIGERIRELRRPAYVQTDLAAAADIVVEESPVFGTLWFADVGRTWFADVGRTLTHVAAVRWLARDTDTPGHRRGRRGHAGLRPERCIHTCA